MNALLKNDRKANQKAQAAKLAFFDVYGCLPDTAAQLALSKGDLAELAALEKHLTTAAQAGVEGALDAFRDVSDFIRARA